MMGLGYLSPRCRSSCRYLYRPKYLSKAGKKYSSIHHMIERMEEKRSIDGVNGIEVIVKQSLLFLDTFYHGMDGNIVLTVPALDRHFGRYRHRRFALQLRLNILIWSSFWMSETKIPHQHAGWLICVYLGSDMKAYGVEWCISSAQGVPRIVRIRSIAHIYRGRR